MIIAPGAVEEPSSAQHRPVRQVEPQIVGEVTLVALPARRRDLHAVVQLLQIYRMTGIDRV